MKGRFINKKGTPWVLMKFERWISDDLKCNYLIYACPKSNVGDNVNYNKLNVNDDIRYNVLN
jgi:hypothetical protein